MLCEFHQVHIPCCKDTPFYGNQSLNKFQLLWNLTVQYVPLNTETNHWAVWVKRLFCNYCCVTGLQHLSFSLCRELISLIIRAMRFWFRDYVMAGGCAKMWRNCWKWGRVSLTSLKLHTKCTQWLHTESECSYNSKIGLHSTKNVILSLPVCLSTGPWQKRGMGRIWWQ